MANLKKKIDENQVTSFIFTIDGLEDFSVVEVTKPRFIVKNGNVSLEEFSVMFADRHNPSLAHSIMNLFAQQLSDAPQQLNATLKILGGKNVREEWLYQNVKFTDIDFGQIGIWYDDNIVRLMLSCEAYTLKEKL